MPLFEAELLPRLTGLRDGYTIRPLCRDDFQVVEILKVLTTVGDVSPAKFSELYDWWESQPDTYFVVVVTDATHRIVACGTLFIERKLIHELGRVGHIEDIAVSGDQQGLKLGKHLIEALTKLAEAQRCYKVILDCDEKNVGFYEKCAYKRAGVEMERRF